MNGNKVRIAVRGFLEKMKAMDEAIPAELGDDALEMAEAVADALEEEKVEDEMEEGHEDPTVDEDPITEEKVEKIVEDSITKVLMKHGIIRDKSMAALDELEAELGMEKEDMDDGCNTLDVDGEEEVTVDPEKIGDSAEAVRRMIREMKPVIAGVKDARTRKKLVDSLVRAARMNQNTTTDYSSIFKATTEAAKRGMDSVPATQEDDYDLGRKIAEAWNPHYKKEG